MPVVKELASFDLSFFCRTKANSEATGVLTMARVIAEHCIETQDTVSVDVCRTDYIHPNKNTAYNAAKQAQPGGSNAGPPAGGRR